MEIKYFLPKELQLLLMNPLIYLIMILKNLKPPHWIILEIWALESFISADILLLCAFLNFVFWLVVSNFSWGNLSPSSIFGLILKVVPVLFLTAVFSFFSCVSDNFHFLYCIQPIICSYKTFVVALENCKTVSLDFS